MPASVPRTYSAVLSVCAIAAALIAGGSYFVYVLLDSSRLFVHPDWYRYILQESLRSGLGLGFDDVINSLQLRSPGEFRPRFLAYFVQEIDQKLRLFGYTYFVVHPTIAPLAWLFQLVIAPILLYRLLRSLTLDVAAAWVSTAVYVTAIGFLSGFTMGLLQGKALVNVAFIGTLYAAAIVNRNAQRGNLFFEVRSPAKYVMLAVVFVSLFLDELAIFEFLLISVMFPRLFVPESVARETMRRILINGLVFALPGVLFLVIVTFVVPLLTQHYFGYIFDYFGNTLVVGENKRGAISIFEGPYATLSVGIIAENFSTLFGLSLVPGWISPLTPSPYGDYAGGQVNNLPKVLALLAFLASLGWLAWRSPGASTRYLRGALCATGLFVLYLSVLLIRHLPVATGYYYGTAFAVMFALLAGLAYGALPRHRDWARLAGAVTTLAVVLSQIANFTEINAGWIRTHNEAIARPSFTSDFQLAPPRPVTHAELRAIWESWRQGGLEAYVRNNEISSGAIYLVFELRAIDRWRSGDGRSA